MLFGFETAAMQKRGRTGGGRVVEILIGRGEDGQEQERAHQKDNAGQTFWRQNQRGQNEIVWTSEEEGQWIYWQKDAQDGATRQQAKRRLMMKNLNKKSEMCKSLSKVWDQYDK